MSHPCKRPFLAAAWLCYVLVALLPAVARAAPSPEGVAFLGVSIGEQLDPKLSELLGRRLARMGEELLPRTRTKYCKDTACFGELAQNPALRSARFLLSAEVYQSDARQQSITVRLFDVEHNKLEEAVDACEQCDDDRRSELILVRYGQLRQHLSSPQPVAPPPPPLPNDVCPNVDGVQTTVPDGLTTDFVGNCVVPPRDLCPNIAGAQDAVPKGMVRDKLGNCMMPSPADLCPNMDGIQTSVPAGMVRDGQGLCLIKQSGDAAGRRQRLRIMSAITGGMALGILGIGVVQAALSLQGQKDCLGIDGNNQALCSPSYVMPTVELSIGGALSIISIGLAIPLGQRN